MLFITSLPVSSKTVVHLYHSQPLKKALFYYSTSTSLFYYCTHAPSQKSRELCHLSNSKISVILFSSCLFNPRFDIHLNCYLYLKREIVFPQFSDPTFLFSFLTHMPFRGETFAFNNKKLMASQFYHSFY